MCDDFHFYCMGMNWLCTRGDCGINKGERGGWGPPPPPDSAYRICYKMANYGQISGFKISIEVSWQHQYTIGKNSFSSSSSFSFIYPTVSSGTQSIHSHAAKMEIITQKILEMNNRGGDSRINEGERGGWGE